MPTYENTQGRSAPSAQPAYVNTRNASSNVDNEDYETVTERPTIALQCNETNLATGDYDTLTVSSLDPARHLYVNQTDDSLANIEI